LFLAVGAMIVFSLFVEMSEGATFSVVPFVNRKALGSVAGIVGAGGNAGAVAFGFLFRAESLTYADALLIVGVAVVVASSLVLAVRFSPETERAERRALDQALAARSGIAPAAAD
ncbi:MAG: MFS transporter, partial [Chloroflexi bacterium]|nr:MFS transporter [Chloroflexota bacterium]